MTKTEFWQTIVGIGPDDPVIFPHLSTAQRDILTTTGDLGLGSFIFNTDTNQTEKYDPTGWIPDSSLINVPTIAALAALTVRPKLVFVQSFISAGDGIDNINDGGGGWFYWVALSTKTIDDINSVSPTGTPVGRYLRVQPTLSMVWTVVSTNFNVLVGGNFLVDTSATAITMVLPTNPLLGCTIDVQDQSQTFAINNLTIDRNGKRIIGLDENFICNVPAWLRLVYVGGSQGWNISEQ